MYCWLQHAASAVTCSRHIEQCDQEFRFDAQCAASSSQYFSVTRNFFWWLACNLLLRQNALTRSKMHVLSPSLTRPLYLKDFASKSKLDAFEWISQRLPAHVLSPPAISLWWAPQTNNMSNPSPSSPIPLFQIPPAITTSGSPRANNWGAEQSIPGYGENFTLLSGSPCLLKFYT